MFEQQTAQCCEHKQQKNTEDDDGDGVIPKCLLLGSVFTVVQQVNNLPQAKRPPYDEWVYQGDILL